MPSPVDQFGADVVMNGDARKKVDGIRGHRQEQRILATSTGIAFDDYESVGPDQVRGFVDEYPTPMDFEETSSNFLDMIRRNNSPEKYQEYLQSMDSFQRKIYGRKYSYYLASKEEQQEQQPRRHERYIAAEKKPPMERSRVLRFGERIKGLLNRSRSKGSGDSETVPVVEPPEVERRVEGDEALQRLSTGESREIMRRAVMEGAPLRDKDGRERVYTTADLREAELEPRYGLRLEGVDFGFSEAFRIGTRDAVIAYVSKDGGNAFVRGYYRSTSQGVWRYLPDRAQKPNGGMDWYGKGQGEEAITLPSEIQSYLNKIDEARFNNQLSKDELAKQKEYMRATMSQTGKPQSYRELIGNAAPDNTDKTKARDTKRYWTFFGTAGAVAGSGPGRNMANHLARVEGSINDALSREVSPKPRFTYDAERPPEQMTLLHELSPDYDREVSSYEAHSDKYGAYSARTFLSKGGALKWTIMEDEQGRAWVGQVEVQSPITSTGLRSQWVRAGNLAMPLYEYAEQDEGYGDYSDTKGRYVSMWNNYLSKIPLIREYKAMRDDEKDERSA